VVVTGDVTQIDIAGGRSGLLDLEELLGEIDGISFIQLGQADVVRHRIVREIVTAYDRSSRARSIGAGAGQGAQTAASPIETKLAGAGNATHEDVPGTPPQAPPARPSR
jgi:phosphate starvation-inducible PhoH-like protein